MLINKIGKTVRDWLKNELTITASEHLVFDELTFAASYRWLDVADEDEENLYIGNPSENSKPLYLSMIESSTTGQALLDIEENVTIDTTGSDIPVFNRYVGSENESVMDVMYGGSYSGGTSVHTTILPGGLRAQRVGTKDMLATVVIPPDNSLLVTVTNNSGAKNNISIRVLWVEKEKEEYDW